MAAAAMCDTNPSSLCPEQVRDGTEPQRIFSSVIIHEFYWELSGKSDPLFFSVAVRVVEQPVQTCKHTVSQ